MSLVKKPIIAEKKADAGLGNSQSSLGTRCARWRRPVRAGKTLPREPTMCEKRRIVSREGVRMSLTLTR